MIDFSDHDRRVLSSVGHGAYGRELIDLLEKAKRQLCSLESIKPGGDHNSEVEGRILFKQLADEFIKHLTFEKHRGQPLKRDNYE